MPPITEEQKIKSLLISQYPREQPRVRRGVIIAIILHLVIAAMICLATYFMGIETLKELLEKGGSIETTGPAPEEPMTVELQLEDITPPPVQNPEFIKEIEKPKVKPPEPPKKIEKPVDKPKPRYTAPNAHGSGQTDTVSKFVLGSSGLPHPGYPVQALHQRQEGTVRLHVIFDSGGSVGTVDITSSSGVVILDTSTRNFVKGHWHNPGLANQAVDVPIIYSLTNPNTSQ